MDPQATLALASNPDASKSDRRQARRNLAVWIRRGGFVPVPRSQWEATVLHDIRNNNYES